MVFRQCIYWDVGDLKQDSFRSYLLGIENISRESFLIFSLNLEYLCIKKCLKNIIIYHCCNESDHLYYGLWSLFSSKFETFGLGQTIWADKFWGIWGIFSRFISTHFGTVSSLSMFSINQPLFLQKTKPLYPNRRNLFGSGSWIWAGKN